MTKQEYLNLKEELKILAKKLKTTKPEFKQAQRNLSHYCNGHYDAINTRGYKNGQEWEEVRPTFNQLDKKQYELRNDVSKMKYEYRHKHIVYSMARGKTYQQIEPKVREGNEPSWNYIDKLKEQYNLTEKEEVLA